MKDGRQDLKKRTEEFALAIIRLYVALPKTTVAQVLGKQVSRSGTSVGAHYREACRAKSNADFISKMEGALQELDETDYWLNLLARSDTFDVSELEMHVAQADQLMRIFVSMINKVKQRPH